MYDPTIMPPRTLQQLSSFILFYGYLAVLGAAGLSMLLILVYWPQWRVNRSFVEAEGLVVDQRDVPSEGGGFRQVRIRYSVNGVDVEHWNDGEMTLGMDEGRIQGRIRAMAIGERLPVWYDPASPEVVVVERGYWIHWGLHVIAAGSAFFLLYGMAKVVGGVWMFGAQRREPPC